MLDREGGLFLKSIYEIEIPITCVRDTYSDTIKAPITDHDLRIISTKYIYTCLVPAGLSVFTLLPCQIILDMEWVIFVDQFLQDLNSEMSCRHAVSLRRI